MVDFQIICRNVPWVNLYQFLQANLIGRKTRPPGGGAFFALYGYSVNSKNLLLQKCQADFQKKVGNVPRVTLYQISSSQVDWSKNMAAKGRGFFACRNVPWETLYQIPSSHVDL